MKKRLYLMRHGKTVMNEQGLNQGWWDSPLTQEGIDGALLAGKYVEAAGIKPDHAYSSTSERACDTIEYVLKDFPYKRLKGLKEYNFGLYEGKPGFLNPPHPFGDYFVAFGGDSDEILAERMNETLRNIMDKEDHEVVLAVSHGAACARFLRKWLETSTRKTYQSPIPNCSIFVYDYDTEDKSFDFVDMITPQLQQEYLDTH